METLTFHLEEFDGPLDLLLYLVSKNKMDLHNIPILELIEQYTSIINGLGAQRMEAASEFIEMAARLVQMKSYLLLPRSEEAERMKEELTGMLVEYSLCKEVAARLRAMGGECGICHGRFGPIHYDEPSDAQHPLSFVVDEIKPVSKWRQFGYSSPRAAAEDWTNLQPAHYWCNAQKGNKTVFPRPKLVKIPKIRDGNW